MATNHPQELEHRNCFKKEPHSMHDWHHKYWCTGTGLDEDDKVIVKKQDETLPAPGILDGRAAYGDRVQNMKEQAAMITAYLSGRSVVEAHDVPMILNLIKIHRLGKMPDYEDNYADIEGYTTIAREVMGDDMIKATTAKEYREIKARGHQGEGRMMESWAKRTGNPYANVDRDYTIMGSDGRDHSA